MKGRAILASALCLALSLTGCGAGGADSAAPADRAQREPTGPFTADTPVEAVLQDDALGDYGRLLFPVDTGYRSGDTLGELQLTWYNNIDPEETVEIVNTLWQRAEAGETVFYGIYTEAEKAQDPDKADTGLFFFKGEAGAPFAVCNAGGGFAYVGAMQDSFPHALELSKRGYNAFALIYRPAPLARRTCPSPRPWSCSTRGMRSTRRRTHPPLPAWARATGSRTGAPWSAGSRPCRTWASPRSSTTIPACPTALAWAPGRSPRAGWTRRSPSGRRRERRNPDEIKWIFWRKGSAFP